MRCGSDSLSLQREARAIWPPVSKWFVPACFGVRLSALGKSQRRCAFIFPVWGIVTRHAARRVGIHLSPHDLHDAAATTWAIAAPDRVGVSRDLLGHSDFGTTARHYNRARGIEASRASSQVIAEL
jgi:integrase